MDHMDPYWGESRELPVKPAAEVLEALEWH